MKIKEFKKIINDEVIPSIKSEFGVDMKVGDFKEHKEYNGDETIWKNPTMKKFLKEVKKEAIINYCQNENMTFIHLWRMNKARTMYELIEPSKKYYFVAFEGKDKNEEEKKLKTIAWEVYKNNKSVT